MNAPTGRLVPDDRRAAIVSALAEKPDGVLEAVAEAQQVPMQAVLDALPAGEAIAVPGGRFEDIWHDLTGWGTIMFIVHTRDGVFETKGAIPPGQAGRGYFNIHGDSPIGGHLRADRCAAIYFVDRVFFGRRSCSVQFVNGEGEVMFKVFVGRDEKREMLTAQLAKYEALRERLGAA
jgi:putative heme utilization carrier protein HutX